MAVTFSPDGQLLAVGAGVPSASGEASLWRVSDQKQLWRKPDVHSDTICSLAFSPDGKMIATASSDKFLRVITAENGNVVKSFEGHTGHVLCVVWNSDGKQLATSSADHSAKLWNFETGEQERTVEGHSKEVTCIRYVPNKGLLVTTSGDRVARIIKVDNGQVVRVLQGAKDYLLSCDVRRMGQQLPRVVRMVIYMSGTFDDGLFASPFLRHPFRPFHSDAFLPQRESTMMAISA